jgi:hypothetical protein
MGFGLTRKQALRVASAVQAVESMTTPVGRRSASYSWNPGVRRGKVSEEIGSGAFDSPAQGKVRLYKYDQPSGAWVEADEVDCYNQFATDEPIAVDTPCFVAWISGRWWVTQAGCPES